MKNFLSIISLLLIFSCAQISTPGGGPKDDKPPVVVSETPKNKTINFKGDEIKIRFDEIINVTNINQIIISPNIETKPEIDFKGKILTVKFKDKIDENKTYTINFGNSIVDVNEGNILQNYSYVFSTGNYLDISSIKGFVKLAFNLNEQSKWIVAAYKVDNFNDTTILNKFPDYFTLTDENGNFKIENIADDVYKIFSFNDLNRNLKYDKNEPIAFNTEIIDLKKDSLNTIKLFGYEPDIHEENYIKDSFVLYKGLYIFSIYKPKKLKIIPEQFNEYYIKKIKYNNEIDSIYIFIPDASETEDVIFKKFIDNNLESTFKLKYKRSLKLNSFNIKIEEPLNKNDKLLIKSSNPIKNINKNLVSFKEDTIEIFDYKILRNDSFSFEIQHYFKNEINYSLEIKDSALTDVFGQYNNKKSTSFRLKNQNDFGFLKLNIIKNDTFQYIIQLIENNKEEKVIKESKLKISNEISLDFINPGNYKIKIIKDENYNGKWDNGNIKYKIQPEKVAYLTEPLNIKAFWDIEQSLNINEIFDKIYN
ncbi:MAG: Ig-like domain-containing protein [Bacteroidia bacterium]